MKNDKFDPAVDEIVGLIAEVHKLQMDQLRCNIKAVHKANVSEIDPKEIAEQIMNLPVNSELRPMTEIEVPQPAIHLQNEMVCTAEKEPPYGDAGDLNSLSYVKVGNGAPYGREFYHHCPQREDKLVRLHHVNEDQVHACPVCRLVFK